MDEAKRELVRAWLIKARNDLTTARQMGTLPADLLNFVLSLLPNEVRPSG